MRFGKKGKLSPLYICPFKILNYVRTMAYRMALHFRLSEVHQVFYMSKLKKYHGYGDCDIKGDLCYWIKIL